MNKNGINEDDLVLLLQHTKLFSHFDYAYCKDLINYLEQIELSAGKLLFTQGEPSDGFFIVAKGILTATLKQGRKQKIIGNIVPGETVGELGGISNQPRTLSVIAQTDCLLLKLKRKDLEAFCNDRPAIAFRLMEIIVERSQRNIKLLGEHKPRQHVLLLQGDDDHEYFAAFLKNLTAHLHNITQLIEEIPSAEDLEELLEQAETDRKTLIFLVKPSDFKDSHDEIVSIHDPDRLEKEAKSLQQSAEESHIESQLPRHEPDRIELKLPTPEPDHAERTLSIDSDFVNRKFNFVNKIMVVVNGNRSATLNAFALKMLSGIYTSYVTHYELVLVHADNTVMPRNTAYWLNQTLFTLHHHIRLNHSPSYHRIIRFMNGNPNAVVFGGGGGKTWVCIGALKALHDSNTPIDAIGGTSGGAIIGAFYAYTLSTEQTEKLFRQITSSIGERPLGFTRLTWPIISLTSCIKPTKMIQRLMKDVQIEDLWLPFFAVSTNLSTKHEVIHRDKELWIALRASGSIPGIVPPLVIDGQLYVDGGLLNNLPTDYMRILAGKSANIIAVSLRGKELTKRPNYYFPPAIPFRVGLMRKLRLGYKEYSFPKFFDTFLASLLVGASAKERANEHLANHLISPDLNKFKTLRNKVREINELIRLGYRATIEKLAGRK